MKATGDPRMKERVVAPAPPPTSRRVPYTPPVVPTPPATRRLQPVLFAATLIVADLVALSIALVATYWLRFRSGWFPTPLGVPPMGTYLASLVVVLPVGIAMIYSARLYRPHRAAGSLQDLLGGARAILLTGVLLAAIAFYYRQFSFSRTFLTGFLVVAPFVFVASRRVARVVHSSLRRRGIGIERVAIVGGGEMAERLERMISSRPGTGLEVVVKLDAAEWRGDSDSLSERSLRPGRVRSLLRTHPIDRLLVTDPSLTHEERLDLIEECHARGVRCAMVPDLFEVMLGRVQLEEFDGVPLIGSRLHPLGRVARFKKRGLDLAVAALALVLFSPLLAVIALAVRLDSKGPVLFRQPRVGRDGRQFDIFKYRSMPTDAESSTGPVRATREDARPTRVGRILRRTSLDELPQLWNVLKGEMSLVGPRPERQFFVDQFERNIPRYLERHGVKSGLTGWAQANGFRGDSSIEERTRLDIWYVENWSLRLDLKILVLTAVRFLSQEEAY